MKDDRREYDVEYMGEDRKDMYSLKVKANDIEEALTIAMVKKDKETDYICCIREIMK